MERASSEFPLVPVGGNGEVAIHETTVEPSIPTRLLIVLLLEAVAFALASASGKIPEFAVTLFRALLIF
jgi:hypothetical protein